MDHQQSHSICLHSALDRCRIHHERLQKKQPLCLQLREIFQRRSQGFEARTWLQETEKYLLAHMSHHWQWPLGPRLKTPHLRLHLAVQTCDLWEHSPSWQSTSKRIEHFQRMQ
jgi:hypothetical protein